ncbi:3-carboxy-cis,cis-muconate cycloisomerase [Acidisoma cellulosilytica]|uniref:3-carboxy-cis,cis-muconate cycloisomerase n=1 Tax=Acidisoma cellulosilyticum TaxID=2802395 RepID=A0A963Z2Y6_9PROT|nr:lyase family protein [Acidisoma cellulosilyticum]MCB8881529.1 3-carboxy-cis,cis-muconate cycloisomerase [Acidisoma cellulosilyticum]
MRMIFADAAVISHALAFEAALAQAEAAEGLIAREAAEQIAATCRSIEIDAALLADEVAHTGTLAIPLLRHLRAALPPEAAAALHKGATSQDLADTVLMLQTKAAAYDLRHDLQRIVRSLAILAKRHAGLPAIGRTLLQNALPIGFGLRLAQIALGLHEAVQVFDAAVASGARIQFGGAAGTRAGLAGRGVAVAAHLASTLKLAPSAPWHNRRIAIASIAAALGMVIGALGKFARDIALLSQDAVGEAREPLVEGRGGSSAMAHKRNPTGCQVALSAALRAPGLVAGILAGLPQEEERGLGGWQAEGPALADLFLLAAGSAAAMAVVADGLDIDEASIARNLSVAGIGEDIGESLAIVAALLAQIQEV